ncbi:hypothetical protein HU727_012865 [Pseudomonas sp. SWRI153]|uniref:Uncharacterized protein n=1 Tax=Pseudomonas khorasanensis TaxID=2745508 RepID=A0A923F3Y9_9PSED|nr:hypothetical protein [Pseudomonas khorasanensis]MBV4486485.1 hypothetical protein [Pseudomonas khorasanensis]
MASDFSVLIVGASILILPKTDRVEIYDDSVNSILLAQLVANKKIEKEPGLNWYDVYISVLDDFWLRHQKTRQTWNVSNSTEETSLEFFSAALSYGALGQTCTVAKVLAQMGRMSGDEPAIQLLRSHMAAPAAQSATVPAPSTTVRLLVTYADSPSSITTSFVEFSMREAVAANPFLQAYQPDNVEGLVQANHARASLSETRYGPVRDAIALKVRERRAISVATLTSVASRFPQLPE